jgi:dTDP-glucose 4,6-dehydratase
MSSTLRPESDTVIVTGGAGFIGSAVVRELLASTECRVVNVDCLTYAGNLETLDNIAGSKRYVFEQANICDADSVRRLFDKHNPTGVIHLAAESHVDRSIDSAGDFVQTNIIGTYTLLEAVRTHQLKQGNPDGSGCRFLHVSTDEVFGSLGANGVFSELSPYEPNSPYSASKASADHLVRAWGETYGLNVAISNCSNNYGPYQFPEKLVPVVIEKAMAFEPIPVYGAGENIRDWLYVDDHARALKKILFEGRPGRRYNIGGNCEKRNIDVVKTICTILDELKPLETMPHRENLIQFVEDRPGHDYRYAIDCHRLQEELGWSARETFVTGLRKTIEWYVSTRGRDWVQTIRTDSCSNERLGLGR